MLEKLTRFLERIKNDVGIANLSETDTKSGIIEPILRMLGWDFAIFNSEVRLEYPVQDGRIDYCLQTNESNKVFLEAKKTSEDLEKHKDQLLRYAFRDGVDLAILSNGVTWSFFLPLAKDQWERRQFYTVDINERDLNEAATGLFDFLSKENISSGYSIEKAKKVLADKKKKRIITESIPLAWNRTVDEPDDEIMNLLAEKTNKVCGYQPSKDEIKKFFQKYSNGWLLTPEDDEERPEITATAKVKRRSIKRDNTQTNNGNRISQEQLAKEIIITLQSLGGRAEKNKVLDIINKKYEKTFSNLYYQQLVSHGVPRWRHNIAWAKEAVKHRGYLKKPKESGRGIWELTADGKNVEFKL